MRLLVLTALLAGLATTASAAPASVNVSVAPKLQKVFDKDYGVREEQQLVADLKRSVEREAAKSAALDGARIELVLTDVKPNRPTFKQMGDKPGLSMESFGVGGAAITGRVIDADGHERPVSYRWYETDIRQAYGHWVWTDATWTFDRFARRLARGDELAQR
jgi:hypothetical protein